MLAARAGMPRVTAARAAPTVPDSSVAVPMFWPALMPEITRSGVKSRPFWSMAHTMVSAGVPATALAA